MQPLAYEELKSSSKAPGGAAQMPHDLSFRSKRQVQSQLTKDMWLDHSHYEDAAEAFHAYDPASWNDTIKFAITEVRA